MGIILLVFLALFSVSATSAQKDTISLQVNFLKNNKLINAKCKIFFEKSTALIQGKEISKNEFIIPDKLGINDTINIIILTKMRRFELKKTTLRQMNCTVNCVLNIHFFSKKKHLVVSKHWNEYLEECAKDIRKFFIVEIRPREKYEGYVRFFCY